MTLREKLKNAVLKQKQIEKVNNHFASAKKQLAEDSKKLDQLEKQLKKEAKDVERLEKNGVRSFFYKTLGNKEAKLDEERQEYVAVSLRYNELHKSVNLLEFELDLLQKKLQDKAATNNEVEALKKMREKELLKTNPGVREKLRQLNAKINHTHVIVKDVDEAIAAGGKALQVVHAMIRELRSARNWGQYDMMGDRRSAGHVKHRAIDRTYQMSTRAKHLLARFQEELNDVYRDLKLDLRIRLETVNKFTDIFFDNLITDFVVQQKIKKTLENIMFVSDQVERTIRQLQSEKPKQVHILKDIEEQREQIILNA